MNKDLARTHAGTLREWAKLYADDGAPGTSEVSFLLKRAASTIEKGLLSLPGDPEPPEPEPDVTELRAG